jgi:hypothetical protein
MCHRSSLDSANSSSLSFGVPGRLPRDVPDGGATFNGVFIPAGVS